MVVSSVLAGPALATSPYRGVSSVQQPVIAVLAQVWLVVLHLKAPVEGRRSTGRIVLSAVLFLAALMSKENAVFVWPVLILIDIWSCRNAGVRGSSRNNREWLNSILGPSHAAYALTLSTFLCFRCYVFGWKTHLDPERTRSGEVGVKTRWLDRALSLDVPGLEVHSPLSPSARWRR